MFENRHIFTGETLRGKRVTTKYLVDKTKG